jgi:hypothetical protein
MPILIRFLCVLSILCFAVVPDLSLQGQHRALPKKCVMPTNDPLTPEYIVSQVRYTPDRPAQKYLLISVRPDQFTKEQMIALATRLRLEFCEETKFGAMLFDDDYAAKHVTFLSSTKDLEMAQRGRYYLDRQKKREYILFSTARGNRLDEVRIDLQPGR